MANAVTEPEPERSADGNLLLECLAAPDGDRSMALEQLCRAHPDRAAALRELYDLLDQVGLVDEPAPESAARAPERFGPYRVLELLGSGGMGVVYLAEHEQLGRRVALKVIHGGSAATPKARERFRREALAAARLDHPGICPVYEVGSADGVPFLAMRYVTGETLQKAIAKSRAAGRELVDLPHRHGDGEQAAVLRLVEQAARALHVAHEAGLVHRDIKPGNLLITPDGEPVLVDFGLARREESDDNTLTLTGDLLGTPNYMAPEQVSGGAVDRRSDVHALGVLLYECLTLRLPFDATNRHDLQSQILRDAPPDPRRSHRRIGRDLWTVLQAALAKEPARRYRTADAFAEDLRRVREHEPILARRAGAVLRLQRFVRRNPVAAGFVLFLLVALAGFAALLQQRGQALDQAARSLRTASANEQALRARDFGAVSPRRGLECALAAVEAGENVDTVSALHAAVIAYRERACLQHEATVWGASFSPDGQLIVTWSDDKTAGLWDRHGRQLATLTHRGPVWSARFDSTSSHLATAAGDGTVVLWNRNGEPLRTMHAGRSPGAKVNWERAFEDPTAASLPWAVAFSPDDRKLAVVCSDRCARVFDVATGNQLGPLFRHEGLVQQICWSPDGRIATADDCGEHRLALDTFEVAVWQPGIVQHMEEARFRLPDSVHEIEFSPDGKALVAACRDGNAYVFDLMHPEAAPVRLAHRGSVWQAAFSADGRRIVTCSRDCTVRLWSRDGTPLREVRQEGPVRQSAFTADGARILTASDDHTIRVFDAELREVTVLRGHTERTTMARLSPDGRQLASSSSDRTARIWDLVDDRVPRLTGHNGPVRGLVRRSDGSAVSIADDNTLRIWDLATATARAVNIAALSTGLVLSRDERSALVSHDDLVWRCLDLESGQIVRSEREPKGTGQAAIFLSDGRVLTSGLYQVRRVFAADGSSQDWGPGRRRTYALASAPRTGLVAGAGWGPNLTIWDEAGEKQAHFLIDPSWHRERIQIWSYAVAFSPTEDRIVVGSGDGRARVFDLRDRTPTNPTDPLVLDGHDGRVGAVAWSPDGALLATGATDSAARLWDARTGELLAVLRGHIGAVNGVVFTDDGRLLTGGDDGAIQAWVTSKEELKALARQRLGAAVGGKPKAR